MGIYSDLLDLHLLPQDLVARRRAELIKIGELRGSRDILVIAADLGSTGAPISIDITDITPVTDQLENLNGENLDVIIETPGGSGEVAEKIVRMLRNKYENVSFLVPGFAMSAGTIMAMAGDEILMGSASSLGPIDAQMQRNGRAFSADALLDGMEKIKAEVLSKNMLNPAYIPILQSISPGELQHAQNSLDFAKTLVSKWLEEYKFKNWDTRRTGRTKVTPEERATRAKEIAGILCDHKRWLTHGRFLKIGDLEKMGLQIFNFEDSVQLSSSIRTYYALLRLTFEATGVYKLFETPSSVIYRSLNAPPPVPRMPPPPAPQAASKAHFDVECQVCKRKSKIQANLGEAFPLDPMCHPFPQNNNFSCPGCNADIDLIAQRKSIEAQAGKEII